MAFVLLHNARFNFHCYTQCEATPTQKLAQKRRCNFLRERLQGAFTRAIQLHWTTQHTYIDKAKSHFVIARSPFCNHLLSSSHNLVIILHHLVITLLWSTGGHLTCCCHLRLLHNLLRMLHLPIIILHHLVIILLPWHLFTILWPSGQHLLWCHDWYCIQFYTLWWFILGCLILLLWFCLLVGLFVFLVCFLCVRWHCNFP